MGSPLEWPLERAPAAPRVGSQYRSLLLRPMRYPLNDRGQSIFETRIQVGDLVTDRGFLSGFTSNRLYLDERFANLGAPRETAYVLLEIDSDSARPLPVGAAEGEVPWLIPRNRVFRVQGISIGEPVGDLDPTHAQRIAVKLQEVDPEPVVDGLKNLHSGERIAPYVVQSPAGTRLSDWLGIGQRYAHYAVDLSAFPRLSADPVPGADGFIRRADRLYIPVEAGEVSAGMRYYRVVRDANGARVVHPQEPLARAQIPVQYDAARGRWELQTIQADRGGASRFVRSAMGG
jgi:hypothetical protein